MKKNEKKESLFDREMKKASFRKKYEEKYPLFKIEVQLLNELERNGLTYVEFAEAIGTKKSNISRDLKGGGIQHITLQRLKKMAAALNCDLVPLIIPRDREEKVLPQIRKLLAHG